jgi:uncharacterized membrane protein
MTDAIEVSGDPIRVTATPVPSNPKATAKLARLAAYSFSGPLPPPELLDKYNDVIPNGAERIMQMAEGQQRHRQELEKTVITGNVKSETRGQYIGGTLCVLVLLLGSFLAYTGKQIAGSVFVGTDLAAIAGVFVYGKHQQQKDLEKKNDQFRDKKK